MNRSNPVGFLSSGISGLTIVKEAASLMPNENIVFFADTARAPYGNKSNEAITEFALQGARFLMRKNIKLLVVACNSVSSSALDALRNSVDVPVIGVTESVSRLAAEETKNKKIGVIGNDAVIRNKSYSAQIKNINPKIKVYEKAAPLLAQFAEEGLYESKAANLYAKEGLEGLKKKGIDTLVLGSASYPLIESLIAKTIGKKVNLVSSGISTSFIIKNYLEGRGIRSQSVQIGQPEYYVTDLTDKVKSIAVEIMGKKMAGLKKAEL